MNDAEEAVRRLFTAAAEDIPPGIDLLGGLRTRRRTSMVRARVLLSAATAKKPTRTNAAVSCSEASRTTEPAS